MTSKSSFSELLKENLRRRIWSAALTGLLFFFMFPIAMLQMAGSRLDPSNFINMTDPEGAMLRAQRLLYRSFLAYVQPQDGFLSFFFAGLAVLIGASAFQWLHNAKKTDFYHSLPVSRTRLFHAANAGSLLIVGVPYIAMSLIAGIIIQSRTGYADCIPQALYGALGHLSYFFLYYMTVVLAMMLTGNTFVGLLGTGVFFAYGPAVLLLLVGMMSTYFRTFYSVDSRWLWILARVSPFTWTLSLHDAGAAVPVQIVSSFLAGLVLMFVILWIYRRRPSEAAGRAMAFKRTEAPIKFLVTVPAALAGSLFFRLIRSSDAWAVFGLLCGLLISYAVFEIIYHFDFRQLFAHRAHLVLCGLIAFAVFAFFRFDLSGYDRYLPAEGEAPFVSIHCNTFDYILNYHQEPELRKNEDTDTWYVAVQDGDDRQLKALSSIHCTDVDNVRKIAACCIDFMETWQGDIPYDYDLSGEPYLDQIYIVWHLKNGSTKVRQYRTDLREIAKELDQVYDSLDYKESFYPLFQMELSDLSGVNYQDIDGYHHVPLAGEEDKNALLLTYLEEFSRLTMETRRHEMPLFALQFKSHEFQRIADVIRSQEGSGYLGMLNEIDYYPVYPSFTKTIALIEKLGVHPNANLDPDRISSVIVTDSRSFRDLSWNETLAARKPTLIVKDPAQIRELLQSATITGLNVDNRIGPQYYGLDISIRPGLWEAASDDEEDPVVDFGFMENEDPEESENDYDEGSDSNTESDTEYDTEADIIAAIVPEPVHGADDDLWYNEAEGQWYDDNGRIEYYSYTLYLDKHRIPDFIREHFEIDEDDIETNSNNSY